MENGYEITAVCGIDIRSIKTFSVVCQLGLVAQRLVGHHVHIWLTIMVNNLDRTRNPTPVLARNGEQPSSSELSVSADPTPSR